MPLDQTFVKSRPTGLYISETAAAGAEAAAPNPVTFTVKSAASKGATSIDIAGDVETTLYPNQVLVFNEGDGDEVTLVVTEEVVVATSSTSVTVDGFEGEVGAGIADALGENDEAEWDGLFRVMGTVEANFGITEGTSSLTSNTYDSTGAVSWDESDATSKAFNVPRQGRFKPHDKAYRIIMRAAMNDREVFIKHVAPDEKGNPAKITTGRAKVRAYSESNPADGIYDVSYTLEGQGKPSVVFADEQ